MLGSRLIVAFLVAALVVLGAVSTASKSCATHAKRGPLPTPPLGSILHPGWQSAIPVGIVRSV